MMERMQSLPRSGPPALIRLLIRIPIRFILCAFLTGTSFAHAADSNEWNLLRTAEADLSLVSDSEFLSLIEALNEDKIPEIAGLPVTERDEARRAHVEKLFHEAFAEIAQGGSGALRENFRKVIFAFDYLLRKASSPYAGVSDPAYRLLNPRKSELKRALDQRTTDLTKEDFVYLTNVINGRFLEARDSFAAVTLSSTDFPECFRPFLLSEDASLRARALMLKQRYFSDFLQPRYVVEERKLYTDKIIELILGGKYEEALTFGIRADESFTKNMNLTIEETFGTLILNDDAFHRTALRILFGDDSLKSVRVMKILFTARGSRLVLDHYKFWLAAATDHPTIADLVMEKIQTLPIDAYDRDLFEGIRSVALKLEQVRNQSYARNYLELHADDHRADIALANPGRAVPERIRTAICALQMKRKIDRRVRK